VQRLRSGLSIRDLGDVQHRRPLWSTKEASPGPRPRLLLLVQLRRLAGYAGAPAFRAKQTAGLSLPVLRIPR
jgi:hypothetical protein